MSTCVLLPLGSVIGPSWMDSIEMRGVTRNLHRHQRRVRHLDKAIHRINTSSNQWSFQWMDWIHTRDDISVQKHGGLDKPMDGCEKEKDMWRCRRDHP